MASMEKVHTLVTMLTGCVFPSFAIAEGSVLRNFMHEEQGLTRVFLNGIQDGIEISMNKVTVLMRYITIMPEISVRQGGITTIRVIKVSQSSLAIILLLSRDLG